MAKRGLSEVEQELTELLKAKLDENGHELVNPIPVAPPVGWKKQPSMVDYIREIVRGERLKAMAEEAGADTFEEADDFEVGDDYDPRSPYEEYFDPTPMEELVARAKKANDDLEAAQAARSAAGGSNGVPPVVEPSPSE